MAINDRTRMEMQAKSHFHKQENSAGRPSSQSHLPRFESFRYIEANVFLEEDITAEEANTKQDLIAIEWSGGAPQNAKRKKRPAKRDIFNLKNNQEMKELRQKQLERNFYSEMNSPWKKKSMQSKPDYSWQQRGEKKQSIKKRLGEILGEDMKLNLNTIDKSIGLVMNNITSSETQRKPRKGRPNVFEFREELYDKEPYSNFNKRDGPEDVEHRSNQEYQAKIKKISNRYTTVKDIKSVKKKSSRLVKGANKKSISKKRTRKIEKQKIESLKESKSIFESFMETGKAFSLLNSSLKNSLLEIEKKDPNDMRNGFSLTNSHFFKKKKVSKNSRSVSKKQKLVKSRNGSLKKDIQRFNLKERLRSAIKISTLVPKPTKKAETRKKSLIRKSMEIRKKKPSKQEKIAFNRFKSKSDKKKLKKDQKNRFSISQSGKQAPSKLQASKKPTSFRQKSSSIVSNSGSFGSSFAALSRETSNESFSFQKESPPSTTNGSVKNTIMRKNVLLANNFNADCFKKRKSLVEDCFKKRKSLVERDIGQVLHYLTKTNKKQTTLDFKKKTKKSNNKMRLDSSAKSKGTHMTIKKSKFLESNSSSKTQNRVGVCKKRSKLKAIRIPSRNDSIFKTMIPKAQTSRNKRATLQKKSTVSVSPKNSNFSQLKPRKIHREKKEKKIVKAKQRNPAISKGYKNLYKLKKETQARLRKVTRKNFEKLHLDIAELKS